MFAIRQIRGKISNFKQAFGNVRHWKIVEDLKISPKVIKLPMMNMNDSKVRVKINNNVNDPFDIKTK